MEQGRIEVLFNQIPCERGHECDTTCNNAYLELRLFGIINWKSFPETWSQRSELLFLLIFEFDHIVPHTYYVSHPSVYLSLT